MDKLSLAALDWALTHIQKFGDTDVFPIPFEYEAISHSWLGIRSELVSTDLSTYRPGALHRTLVPKPGGGFRIAVQLDPVDALVYTAMLYEAAPLIEKARVSVDQEVVYSYRIQIDPSGSFFPSASGWQGFHARSSHLADSGFTHVLLADIADFYNQIYIHRVQNALESAGVIQGRANNIERFLLSLNAKQSRGIPVGPIGSILLAEITLNDVDRFLLRRGCTFVRYVDDFRIFCVSRKEAIETLHDLTEYLHTAHRLSLESHKTKVMNVNRFKSTELTDPAEVEREAQSERLRLLVEEIRNWTGYDIDPDELADDDRTQAVRDVLVDLFSVCVAKRPLHLGLARHVLRRATSLKTAVLVESVIDSLEILAPVFRDVCKYLKASVPKGAGATKRAGQLVNFLESSDLGRLPFIRMWMLDLFLTRRDLATNDVVGRLAADSVDKLGVRYVAQFAKLYRQIDWVRVQKEMWRNHGSWDRRAVIWSSQILPRGERRPWLDMVKESPDALDRAVAIFAES